MKEFHCLRRSWAGACAAFTPLVTTFIWGGSLRRFRYRATPSRVANSGSADLGRGPPPLLVHSPPPPPPALLVLFGAGVRPFQIHGAPSALG